LWDPQTGELLRTLAAHDDRIESLVFSPGGQLATGGGGKDFSIKLWESLLPVLANVAK
jgi:WD40 repeat protein